MVVGVDVSSRRIDLAWLDNGRPCRWHQELAKGHLIDRLRSIRIEWPAGPREIDMIDYAIRDTAPGHGVTDIAIEYPFGRGNAIAALMATVGVITRQAPPWSRVAWPSSGELRAAIGSKNTKADAHTKLMFLPDATGGTYGDTCWTWSEHELDALVACIGWTRILDSQ